MLQISYTSFKSLKTYELKWLTGCIYVFMNIYASTDTYMHAIRINDKRSHGFEGNQCKKGYMGEFDVRKGKAKTM